ncbi:GMP reductase 1-like isoform X1 [Galleria mellonella]|uniref:GMP reductase n=1 Tax=Galleria mellonella TaxID=7137 RepID=A0A6J1WAX5_GALME|nr:GMP reductase 1-like isoform X1 [Galleria mellonella]
MPNIINEVKLDFKDVLLRPKRSTLKSRNDVDLYREITFRNSGQTYRGVPVMASNMDTVGTFEMAQELSKHGLFTCIHKYYTIEEWKKFAENHPECLEQMAASSGTADADFERLSDILNNVKDLKFVCLDVANGYSQHFVEYVRRVRAAFPTHTIIAGNVVTGEMVEELILSGADIIKVGIGPGSVCTTRIKTGVGYPQLSAVIECADAAHGLKGHIISDGGCTCPGDVAKAFGAGADFVMAGGMFAGHDQCGGEVVTTGDGRKVKLFYGMSSSTAMLKHSGGIADYRSSEGKTVEVEYRGDVATTVKDILGGLRSACTYVGAARLRELPRRATFIRCCRQVNDTFS